MRRLLLVLTLLVATVAVNGCGSSPNACRTPVTGTISFGNGSLPPPYHYEWTVTLEEQTGTVTMSPGYGSTAQWSQTFTPEADQVVASCRQLAQAVRRDVMPGSGHLEVDLRGGGGRTIKLDTSDTAAADAAKLAIPAAAFAQVQSAYERWQVDNPRR